MKMQSFSCMFACKQILRLRTEKKSQFIWLSYEVIHNIAAFGTFILVPWPYKVLQINPNAKFIWA